MKTPGARPRTPNVMFGDRSRSTTPAARPATGRRKAANASALSVVALGVVGVLLGTGVTSTAIGVSDGVTWLPNSTSGEVLQFNPVTGRVEQSVPVGKPGERISVSQRDGMVVFTNEDTDQVSTFDLRAMSTSNRRGVDAGSTMLTSRAGMFLVSKGGQIAKVDPVTAEDLGTPLHIDGLVTAVADDQGTIWAASEDGTVRSLTWSDRTNSLREASSHKVSGVGRDAVLTAHEEGVTVFGTKQGVIAQLGTPTHKAEAVDARMAGLEPAQHAAADLVPAALTSTGSVVVVDRGEVRDFALQGCAKPTRPVAFNEVVYVVCAGESKVVRVNRDGSPAGADIPTKGDAAPIQDEGRLLLDVDGGTEGVEIDRKGNDKPYSRTSVPVVQAPDVPADQAKEAAANRARADLMVAPAGGSEGQGNGDAQGDSGENGQHGRNGRHDNGNRGKDVVDGTKDQPRIEELTDPKRRESERDRARVDQQGDQQQGQPEQPEPTGPGQGDPGSNPGADQRGQGGDNGPGRDQQFPQDPTSLLPDPGNQGNQDRGRQGRGDRPDQAAGGQQDNGGAGQGGDRPGNGGAPESEAQQTPADARQVPGGRDNQPVAPAPTSQARPTTKATATAARSARPGGRAPATTPSTNKPKASATPTRPETKLPAPNTTPPRSTAPKSTAPRSTAPKTTAAKTSARATSAPVLKKPSVSAKASGTSVTVTWSDVKADSYVVKVGGKGVTVRNGHTATLVSSPGTQTVTVTANAKGAKSVTGSTKVNVAAPAKSATPTKTASKSPFKTPSRTAAPTKTAAPKRTVTVSKGAPVSESYCDVNCTAIMVSVSGFKAGSTVECEAHSRKHPGYGGFTVKQVRIGNNGTATAQVGVNGFPDPVSATCDGVKSNTVQW